MTTSVRRGLSAGSTFAVIIVFLALIGFTVTGAALIGKVFGASSLSLPPVGFFVAFMVLLGLWNGSLAARPDEHGDYRPGVLSAGLTAGLVAGIVAGLLALIFGWLQSKQIDPRPYLSMVSPEAMTLYLFNLGVIPATLLHIVLLTASGLLGALLSFEFRRGHVWARMGQWFSSTNHSLRSSAIVTRIRRMPYAIYAVYALLAVLMFILPRQWGSYWNYIIGTIGIYVILGLGLNIIVGMAGQLVLGYVAFFAIGAYTAALLTAPQPHQLQWNFWVVLIVGIVLAALTGILLGLPIMRLRGDYLAIVTLGFGEIIRILLKSDLLTNLTAGPRGVRNIGGPTLFGQSFTSDVDFMYLIILAVALIIFITNRLQNSRTGRAWVAIREDEVAARATGINTFQSKLLALAIGAAFAGLGGILFASRNQFTGPEDHTLMVSINVLALVIVGGMNSIPGIILGSFALKGLPEMLRELDIYRLMFFGGLLVMMMIMRPEGLWPSTRPRMETRRARTRKEGADQTTPAPSNAADLQEGAKHASNP